MEPTPIPMFFLQIYEYQGCQAAQDLLRGQEGETLLTANDQRSLNIRGRLFERFFSLRHVTNVASNGEHLNRECSLFTDDCRYVIVGSAVYVPEEPPPYFFEVGTPPPHKGTILKQINNQDDTFASIVWLRPPLSSVSPTLPGVSQQRIGDSQPSVSPRRLLPPHYRPPYGPTVWHQVL